MLIEILNEVLLEVLLEMLLVVVLLEVLHYVTDITVCRGAVATNNTKNQPKKPKILLTWEN